MNNTNPTVSPSETQVQTSPVSNPIYNKKGFIPIILTVVILLLVVGGGAYYLGMQKGSITTQTQNANIKPTVPSENTAVISPTNVPISTQSPQPNETTNWITFSSTTFNLSYKYPSDWKNDNLCQSCSAEPMNESSSERYLHPVGAKYPDGITYSAIAKEYSAPLSYFINSLKTRNLTNKTSKELSVNGSSGYQIVGNDESGKKIALAVFENNDYIFQFAGSEDYINTLEALLSTVTFK